MSYDECPRSGKATRTAISPKIGGHGNSVKGQNFAALGTRDQRCVPRGLYRTGYALYCSEAEGFLRMYADAEHRNGVTRGLRFCVVDQ
jgi:hypothetical protein